MKRTLIVVLLAVGAFANGVHAQSWEEAHNRKVLLLGGGTDLTNTITLIAPALSTSPLITLPGASLTFPLANGAGILSNNGAGVLSWTPGGSVSAVSIVSANGFAGSSSGGNSPALTISTTIVGMLKGNGTAISAATSGTDYSAGTSALATGILKSTTTTGALSIAIASDFPTLNQNTTGTAANVTNVVTLAHGGTGQDNTTGVAQHAVFAGPSGAAGAASFRALVAADIPTLNQSTSGNAANVTGIVALANGGTNANLTASNGGIFYSTATAGAILAGTATANKILLSGASSAPAWSTATYPATTTINQLLYSNAANTVTGLTTANNGVLVTSSGGVPSISSTLPAAVQGNITSTGIITSGIWNGTPITSAYGGSGISSYNIGDILYADVANHLTALPIGTSGQVLTVSGAGIPGWTSSGAIQSPIYGGNLAGSHLDLISTSNASPSGDYIILKTGGTERARMTSGGLLGLGASETSPNTTLDLNGDFAIRESDLTVTSGTQSDPSTTGISNLYITSASGAFTIDGFSGGYNGKELHIYNKSGKDMTLAYHTGTAGHEINTLSGGDVILSGNGIADFVYDGTANEWVSKDNIASAVQGIIAQGFIFSLLPSGGDETGTGAAITDATLNFHATGGAVYEIQGLLLVSSGGGVTSTFQLGFTAGTGSVISIAFQTQLSVNGNTGFVSVGLDNTENTPVASAILAKSKDYFIPFSGIIKVGVTGTAGIVWNTGSNNTLKAYSYMRAIRLY